MSVFLHRSTDCTCPPWGLDLSGFAPGEPWNHPWSIWEPSSLCFRPFEIFKVHQITSNYKDPKWSQCRNLISTDRIQDARVKGLTGQGWFPLLLHGIWKPGASTCLAWNPGVTGSLAMLTPYHPLPIITQNELFKMPQIITKNHPNNHQLNPIEFTQSPKTLQAIAPGFEAASLSAETHFTKVPVLLHPSPASKCSNLRIQIIMCHMGLILAPVNEKKTWHLFTTRFNKLGGFRWFKWVAPLSLKPILFVFMIVHPIHIISHWFNMSLPKPLNVEPDFQRIDSVLWIMRNANTPRAYAAVPACRAVRPSALG